MANTSAAPIVVPPSGKWDGNDGPWPTFNIHVGTPPQVVRVLVSTALGETWVISANKTLGGCIGNDPSSCPQSRGGLYNLNDSSTWQDQGIYGLGLELNLEDYTQDYDNGNYGLDTLGIGAIRDGSNNMDNIVVAALSTKDFYLGYLGVTPHPTNFTEFNDPQTSYLSTLKQQKRIPSLSYAYSAGARYRPNKANGTLTLGGYDASKFTPNDVPFTVADDISRDLVVGLQSITFSDDKIADKELLATGIFTFIDATVPHIWLPRDCCQAFEDAFGLEYNSTIRRYLVNNTLHNQLLSQNASLTFVLGNENYGGATVNITFPYASFDLEIGSPFVDTSQHYFPLRRAANSTQYTLGRTFLQEAYLIVNYEYSNFSVSQNTWVENAPSQIIALPAAADSTTPAITVTTTTPSDRISTGAIVGIVVAAVVVLCMLAAGIIFFVIRRKRRVGRIKDDKKEELNPYLKAEMDDTSKPPKPPLGELFSDHKFGEEMEGSKPDLGKDMKTREEMEGSNPELAMKAKLIAEAEGSRGGAEMDGCRGGVEMDGSRGNLRAEMPGTDPRVEVEATPTFAAVEMYAGDHGLYERPSPLIGRSGSAVPSPLSAGEERRPAVSSRNRPTRKPLRVASEGSGVSPDDTNAGRRSGGAKTSSPRSARGTPGSLTPNEGISSPSRSQERQHQRDARARRLNGSVSTRPTPSANLSSDDASGDEAWQQRYGGSLRTMEAATPGGGRGAERRRLLGSGNSSGETGDRAPLAGQGTPF